MLRFIVLRLLINAVAIYAAATLLDDVIVPDFKGAIFVALVFGFLNVLVRPLLLILTLPINILTLGLFTLVVNAIILGLTAELSSNLTIHGFGSAILAAIVIGIVNAILGLWEGRVSEA